MLWGNKKAPQMKCRARRWSDCTVKCENKKKSWYCARSTMGFVCAGKNKLKIKSKNFLGYIHRIRKVYTFVETKKL